VTNKQNYLCESESGYRSGIFLLKHYFIKF